MYPKTTRLFVGWLKGKHDIDHLQEKLPCLIGFFLDFAFLVDVCMNTRSLTNFFVLLLPMDFGLLVVLLVMQVAVAVFGGRACC